MAISKLTANVNNHQTLPDKPALSAEELKILFDKGSADIKEYINNTMLPEIDSLIENLEKNKLAANKIINDLTTGGSNNVASAETVKDLKIQLDNVNDSIQTKINNSISNLGLKNASKMTITSGTNNPSGGSNGDIYIQYF